MKIVEFWTAVEWICDECGRNNYSSMITPELTEEDEKELKDKFSVESWEEGNFLIAPEHVTCKFCNEKFILAREIEEIDP